MDMKKREILLKIQKSVSLFANFEEPPWAMLDESGGHTVHPVPAPLSTILLIINRNNDGGNNQNLMVFIRGNAISGAPSEISLCTEML